jgi:hypothetical protein
MFGAKMFVEKGAEAGDEGIKHAAKEKLLSSKIEGFCVVCFGGG